ncbi:MAG: hypothetical protein MZV63_47335 [Marinilabiliales bacterium]|nr:hypothetical protein [Marinilabiliales bacterium]
MMSGDDDRIAEGMGGREDAGTSDRITSGISDRVTEGMGGRQKGMMTVKLSAFFFC